MDTHRKLITDFYTGFQNKDWKAMQACYHNDIRFQDPVFPSLQGKEAKAMWHMLLSAAKDLTMEFSQVEANDTVGTAHWEAKYSFSKTGRKVHNIIDAKFEFKDGKIIHHTDSFDFWRWSRLALGPSGLLLGWSSWLQNKVRVAAHGNLNAFLKKNKEYQ